MMMMLVCIRVLPSDKASAKQRHVTLTLFLALTGLASVTTLTAHAEKNTNEDNKEHDSRNTSENDIH